jgi:hypothetical protein
VLLAVGLLRPQPAAAQWLSDLFDSQRSFSVTAENDAFGTGHTDRSYTNGVRFLWDFSKWDDRLSGLFNVTSFYFVNRLIGRKLPPINRACLVQTPRAQRPCATLSFSLGQTMYTPAVLTDSALQPNDRPYAGYLFLSAGANVLFKQSQIASTIIVGITGPPSLAKETQSLAHWTFSWQSPQPQGWSHQIRTMPQLTIVNEYLLPRAPYTEWCLRTAHGRSCTGRWEDGRVFDLTPHVEAVLGTLMTRASPGIVMRLGYGFPDANGLQRIPTTRPASGAKPGWQPWGMLFFTANERFVAWNSFISGSLADRGSNGWSTLKQIETEHKFAETAYGIAFGIRQLTFSRQWVTRGDEFTPNDVAHKFGSISVSLHMPAR